MSDKNKNLTPEQKLAEKRNKGIRLHHSAHSWVSYLWLNHANRNV